VGYALGPNGYPEGPFSTIPHPNNAQALLAYTEGYTYDAVGNLRSTLHQAAGAGWTRTQTYVTGCNRIATVSMPGDPANGPFSGVFQHDAAGNLSQTSNLTAMMWDHAGRLASANLGGGGIAYFAYDSQGQRIRKIIQQTATMQERVYIGAYERYREFVGASISSSTVALERLSLHAVAAERRFALVETKTVDTSVSNLTLTPLFRFQCPNQVSSACVETDPTGNVISYEEYYPYGGTSFRSGDTDKRYRFAGKERDEETGLYHFEARYYAPWIGRWISCDPKASFDREDAYIYCSGNPVSRVDPDGRDDIGALVNMDDPKYQAERDARLVKGGERIGGAFAAGFDIGVGTVGLATALLGSSHGDQTLANALEGLRQLPSVVRDTVRNWDKLSSYEASYRVTSAVIGIVGAFQGARGGIRALQTIAEGDPIGAIGSTASEPLIETEVGTGSSAPAPLVGPLIRDASAARKFARNIQRTISTTADHPLAFLINPETRLFWSRYANSNLPTIQVGHEISFFSGAPESFFAEDSTFNQATSNTAETRGVWVEKLGVEIGGVPVELRTAQMWQRLQLLPEGLSLDKLPLIRGTPAASLH
jgi:RHS repeat-associated protein